MTIDEYLSQLPDLRAAEKTARNRLDKLFNKATSTHNSAFDGMPYTKSSENTHETKLIEYADAKKAWDQINAKYFEIRDQLEECIEYLLYWEGCLIFHVYIYNMSLDKDDPLDGAEDILHTNSQHVITAKLSEAKSHLREQLINRGVMID